MDLTLALQRAVRGYPLGTDALAARLCLSVTSLNHKVSPTYPGAHASPEEMTEIQEVTGDHSALHAMAARLGYVALAVPQAADAEDSSAMALAATVREFSDFASAAASGMADNRVTGNELAQIEREAGEAIAAINRLVGLAAAVHAAAQQGAQGPRPRLVPATGAAA